MATLCSHPAPVHLQGRKRSSERETLPKPSGVQRILEWATALTAEVVILTAGDDRCLESDLARFEGKRSSG